MNRILAYLALFTFLVMQCCTWSSIHGFSWDQKILILTEILGVIVLASIQNWGGFAFLVLGFVASWRFYYLMVPMSWWVARGVHAASMFLCEAFGVGFGVSYEGFRIFGDPITADPSKTASLFLLLFAFHYFLFATMQSGFGRAFRALCVFLPKLLGWAILRWIVVAFGFCWLKPDLVSHGWHLFNGIGLVICVFPLLFTEEAISQNEEIDYSQALIRSWATLGLVLVLAFVLPSGMVSGKKANVLIDELHSVWEPVSITSEERENVLLAENNYSAWVRLLAKRAVVSVLLPENSLQKPETVACLTGSTLDSTFLRPDKVDILVLKCVTKPFSSEEQKAVLDFVREGGTLWAIGEHTDVFFMNSHLNELLAPIGVTLRSDGICDHRGRWLVTAGPMHASLEGAPGPGKYMWATGASIDGGPQIIPLAVSSPDAFSDRWVPTNPNFFGNLAPDNSHLYGPFTLAALVPYGKGQIILHGDSTNFNASMISTPGKIAFVNRLLRAAFMHPGFTVFRIFFELIFAILTCEVMGIFLRRGKYVFASLALIVVLAMVQGPFIFGGNQDLEEWIFSANEPLLAVDYSLQPSLGLAYGNQQEVTASNSLDPLLVQLRQENIGMISCTEALGTVLGKSPTAILFADPVIQPDQESMMKLKTWLENGGNILLVAGGNLGGPGRSLVLTLGVQEKIEGNQEFSNLFLPGAFVLKPQEKPEIKIFPVGRGKIALIEHWNSLDFPSVNGKNLASRVAAFLRGKNEEKPSSSD